MTTLSPEIAEVFEGLVGMGEAVSVAELRNDVRAHLREIEEAAESNALLPVDIARDLATALEGLLELVPDLDSGQSRLVTAAARYFTSEHDAVPDTKGVLGLDDDIAVFNHVVERLGMPERKVNL